MRCINVGMSEYLRQMREFDWFIMRLAEGRACAEGPVGLKYYDVLYRAVCGGELADFDAGPDYPIVLAAHHLWRRGNVCAACALLEKARSKKPLFRNGDEITAAKLLEAAVREGAEGVRRIETDDSPWSWASLFKDLLIAELDPRERAEALRRIRQALKLVEEAADLTDEIIEGYNIILPPKTPYIYIGLAAAELERREPPRQLIKNLLTRLHRQKQA
jgi:hypothetical protein